MADLSSGLEKLPPQERLKRLRAIEAQKRLELADGLQKRKKEIEDELAKRKKEIEELERSTKRDLEAAAKLETETIDEITRERSDQDSEELESRLKEFRKGSEFVPEGGQLEEQLATRPKPAGFGQNAYQHEAFGRAEENIAYLMNSANPMSQARKEAEKELYRSVRELADNFSGHTEESYTFNKLQQQVEMLKTRAPEGDSYVNHIASFLNSIVDYRQEDERKRSHR